MTKNRGLVCASRRLRIAQGAEGVEEVLRLKAPIQETGIENRS